jgi:hypothetical protein
VNTTARNAKNAEPGVHHRSLQPANCKLAPPQSRD